MWKLFREAGPFGLSPLGYLFGISEPISPTAEIRRAVFRHSDCCERADEAIAKGDS